MSTQTIAEKVRQIFADHTWTPTSQRRTINDVQPEHRIGGWNEPGFGPDLNDDSLDRVEIVLGIEDEFDLEIPDEDCIEWKTVGDAIAYVEKKKAVA